MYKTPPISNQKNMESLTSKAIQTLFKDKPENYEPIVQVIESEALDHEEIDNLHEYGFFRNKNFGNLFFDSIFEEEIIDWNMR